MKLGLKSVSVAAVAAALALAACGGSDDDGASNTTTAGTAGASNDTVSVADVEGVGEILVDASGRALYFADEEADGQVRCVDGCTSFWKPLEPGSGAPTAAPGVPELGVVDRPDGTEQVTADGRLLYTFSQDSPGDVSGDGFEDDFGSQHLTWHALRVDGSGSMTTSPADTSTGGGYSGYGG
jgi:predicted lipoprotein with Yx(FWY)xxD motif